MNVGMKIVIMLMLVMMLGLFHIVFTVFDYGFNNPESGAFTLLEETMNETLTGDYQSDAFANNQMAREFFGIGRFIIMAIIVIVGAVILFDKPNTSGGG